MIFLNLSSLDSVAYHAENNWHDFTVELPRSIEGNFRCALLEFWCGTPLTEEIYVYTDICEPEYVANSVQPLLRVVVEEGEFSNPYFKTVSRRTIQRVQVYIRNRSSQIPAQNIGSVRVTLGLERI